MRGHRAKSSAMACAVVLATTLSLLAGCVPSKPSADPSRETPAREAPPDPQALLDTATKRMNDEGTGSYVIELPDINTVTKGRFDIDKKVTSQATTTNLPDPELPNGFTFRSLLFKNEVFARVSEGPARKCWMRFEASDFTGAPGGTTPLSPSDFASMTWPPPIAEILESPKARGFVKNSTTEIKADIPLWPALFVALPKAANMLADKIGEKRTAPDTVTVDDGTYTGEKRTAPDTVTVDDGAYIGDRRTAPDTVTVDDGAYIGDKRTAPVTLTVDDGAYTGATYSVGDVLRAADLRPRDLKKAGLSEQDMAPKQAFELMASLRVDITYGTFGQKVDVSRPPKDRIADLDLATMSATDIITCKAAER